VRIYFGYPLSLYKTRQIFNIKFADPVRGYVHIDTSASTSLSPSFRLRVVCMSLVQASPARVERSRSLVQAHNSTRVY